MPIEVHCPACPAEFHVGDEFAGRPGRCPECGVVLRVPEPAPEPTPDPYASRRPSEARDEFPSRRRRDDYRTDEDRTREDFDDRYRGTRSGFDPHARATAWERTRKGLWYGQVAALLFVFSETLVLALLLARGIKNLQPADVDSGLVAVMCGGWVVRLCAIGFWLTGRFLVIRTPYVPARRWAKTGFAMALGAVALSCMFFCLFVMALAAGPGPNPILGLAVLLFLGACLVAMGGEGSGLIAQVQIGKGLNDGATAGWAKVCLVLLFLLPALTAVGICGLAVAADKRAKPNGPAPVAKQADPAPANKDKADPKVNGKDADAPAAGNPPANPAEPEPPDEKVLLALLGILFGAVFIYLAAYSVALLKARGAIRREIQVLTGEADKDPWETGHRY